MRVFLKTKTYLLFLLLFYKQNKQNCTEVDNNIAIAWIIIIIKQKIKEIIKVTGIITSGSESSKTKIKCS